MRQHSIEMWRIVKYFVSGIQVRKTFSQVSEIVEQDSKLVFNFYCFFLGIHALVSVVSAILTDMLLLKRTSHLFSCSDYFLFYSINAFGQIWLNLLTFAFCCILFVWTHYSPSRHPIWLPIIPITNPNTPPVATETLANIPEPCFSRDCNEVPSFKQLASYFIEFTNSFLLFFVFIC